MYVFIWLCAIFQFSFPRHYVNWVFLCICKHCSCKGLETISRCAHKHLKWNLPSFQTRFCWKCSNIAMSKPYRYFEWRAVFSVNMAMSGVRVFPTEIIHLFVLSCLIVINAFIVLWRFILYYYKMERKQRQNISMLKCFSLDLSFKLYSNILLNHCEKHRDSVTLSFT